MFHFYTSCNACEFWEIFENTIITEPHWVIYYSKYNLVFL